MWGVHDGMGWWMLFGSIWFFVFWGLIIWAIVSLYNRAERGPKDSESSLDIARRRYAQGEISREEFEQLRRDLS
jgi:putative membrane protein